MAGAHLAQPERRQRPERYEKHRQRKGFPRIVILLVVVVIAAGAWFAYKQLYDMTADEKYALRLAERYQQMLKDPNSMILRGDVIVIQKIERILSSDDSLEHNDYVYITASGTNSFGATVTSTACFFNGKYYCDLDDIRDDMPWSMDMTEEERNDIMIKLQLKLNYLQWGFRGASYAEEVEEVYEAYAVDGAKIARIMGIKYSD